MNLPTPNNHRGSSTITGLAGARVVTVMRCGLISTALAVILAGCGSSSSSIPTATSGRATSTLTATAASPTPVRTVEKPTPAATRPPTATAVPAIPSPTAGQSSGHSVTDKASGVAVSVGQVVTLRDHTLMFVTMRNTSGSLFAPVSAQPQFAISSVAAVTSGTTLGPCDADSSRGTPLGFLSISAHTTHAGWLRCDYPTGARLFDLAWLGHDLGHYTIVA